MFSCRMQTGEGLIHLQGSKSNPVDLFTPLFQAIFAVSHLWYCEVLEEWVIETLETVF